MTQPLPDGFAVVLGPKTRSSDSGRLLVGGSPLTAMRISPAAAAHLAEGRVTVTDAASAHLADRLIATNLAHPDVRSAARTALDEISVVVPIRDRPDHLDRCLSALSPLAVVVVDDASLDAAAVATVARRHGATLIQLAENVGPAGARNAGLAAVTTRVVAFVDSDVEVSAGDLQDLTRHFADPAVAVVGPRITGRIRSARPTWFEKYDAAFSSLSLGGSPSTVRPGSSVAWLPSACLVAHASALGSGFDADLRVGEDVDLIWRLTAAGHRIRYDPDVVAGHDVRATLRGWLGRKFAYGTSGALLAQRHGSHTAPAVLSPVMAIAGVALLLRRRWSVPVAVAGLGITTRTVRRSLPRDVSPRTRGRVAVGLSAQGVGWAVRQESALLLRHWWPLTVLGLRSPLVRRALMTALVVDAYLTVKDNTALGPSLPIRFAGRRLDDLAYGAGLWWGARHTRSVRTLLPRNPRKRRTRHERRTTPASTSSPPRRLS